ncbi:UDP-N-acetylmuramoyl-L-alanyl-D-glutamate--2,6-diaminopimelate ligase [Desertihabitans brevis]|uniref:UDP-N-acetylmuramoyl-L-alanyl-D-glutamate--2,6-diaminopimelate ligase n=1 Tax=Desertihabitans brevis TaxID=2268447 RepID=A0A367YYF7_9ACTN|nr:UDP-N-acetylmuramoyl-L-alanyl-D-glutamate--2,6-diaminopimelate ligase [Desertihabitans brevis]
MEQLVRTAGETGLQRGADRPVTGLTLDSRQVRPGDLYAALPGQRTHGARFAGDAVEGGAVAVLTDRAGTELLGDLPDGTGLVVVEDARAATARLAAVLYRHPAERLAMLGVTGTNGKTTTTMLVEAALTAAGIPTATVGTLGFRVGGEVLTGERTTVTTPEAPDLQALLAAVAGRGAEAVAMEVSSHALVLGRTEPVVYDVAGFTNLGRDHLDFHPDLEAYFEAKATLFTAEHTRRAVICLDSPAGARLAERCRRTRLPVVTTGPGGDYRAEDVRATPGGTVFDLLGPGGRVPVELSLPGEHNVSNAVLALAMVDQLGASGRVPVPDLARAAGGLARAVVPGRMQRLELPPGSPVVVVDFAHTPQAVEATLRALRAGLAGGHGRLVTAFGCGGDRDPEKRRPMGAAGARYADVVVVTDDNPRSEDPAAIRAEVLAGARAEAGPGTEVLDGGARRDALRLALELAGPDDLVAVLGKGHETGQEVAGVITPFDDAAVLTELVHAVHGSAATHGTGGGRGAATHAR